MAGIGHNSGEEDEGAGVISLTQAARKKLAAVVNRVEALIEEKAAVQEQIKDVYAEAKAMGYDTKTIRNVVKFRAKDPTERDEEEAILHTYLSALGLI